MSGLGEARGVRDLYSNVLSFRSDSKVSEDQLNSLALRYEMLRGWNSKIQLIGDVARAGVEKGKLRLDLPLPEALKQFMQQTNFGTPDRYYKEMQEEVLVTLSDYRANREMTERHYGSSADMERIWSDVIGELNVAWTNEMYEEARIQTNLEIYEEVYKNELAKVQAELKKLRDLDLHPLRLDIQEKVNSLIAQRGDAYCTPRSARGLTFQTPEASWFRHFTRNSDGVLVNSRQTKLELAPYKTEFMNHIFSRALIASRQSEGEIAKQKY